MSIRSLSRVLSAFLLSLTLIVVVPGHSLAATVQLWTASSYDNVFQDATRPANFTTYQQYVVARNEYESFQILTRSTDAFTITGVDFTNLTSGANSVAAANLSYNFVEYSYSSENTPDFIPSPKAVRVAPAYFPDALSNEPTIAVPANSTQPIWVTLYVPKTANPGIYTGSATVHTTSGDLTAAIQAEVSNVTIPDANAGSFTTMNHQQIAGTWFFDATAASHPNDVIVRLYQHERWTPQWWELVDDMIAQLRTHRVNSLFVNTQQLLLDGGTTMDNNGQYTFNWSRFDEYINRFISAGVVKQLEGIHLGSVIGDVGVTYQSYILKKINGTMQSTNVDPASADSANWLGQFIPALHQHLQESTTPWLSLWYQHIGDEAVSELQKQQYATYMSYINAQNPRVRTGDPTFSLETANYSLSQGASLTIPSLDLYEDNKAVFDNHLRNGKQVFVYNMCCVGPDNLNRFVDRPVWEGRNLGWVLYKYGLPGYLHWAWNVWIDWNQTQMITIDDETHKGDHYSVYPDIPRNRIKSTIRFEATRDMAEDYELLNLVGREHQQAVRTLIDSVASEFDTFSRDKANMIAKRAELVRLAASPAGRLYTNPVGNVANPNVVKVGNTYHLVASDGNRIAVRSSANLESVASAPPQYVWSNMTFTNNLWVSDLKFLNGRWYLYFNGDTGTGQRTHVLEGGTDAADPLNGSYAYKARLFDGGADLFAVSGTVVVHNGTNYFVWSGLPTAGASTQNLYAAPMSNPWTLSGARSAIAQPDQSWEAGVLDTPEVFTAGGTSRILYSANNSGSDASQLGQLTLTGSNPLLSASWTKSASPAFASGDGVFGPGFPAVTTSPDGSEYWLMYHARRFAGSGYDRTTRLQRITWKPDGTPNLGTPWGPGQAHAVPSGTPATTGVYEAEQGTVNNALVGYESEASRKQVVYGIDNLGSSVSLNVNVSQAGEYMMTVRNATGYNGAQHSVYVNGANKGKLSYPNLGWNRFSTVGMLVTLNAGNNTVKFQKDSASDQYAEIDYIGIGDRLEAEEGVLQSAVYLHEPQASGAGEAAGIDTPNSSAVELYVNVPSAGLYSLETVNSTGYSPASHLLKINGSYVPDVHYYTNGWGNFSSPATNLVTLNAGNNVVRYEKSVNHAGIDHIRLHKIGTKYEAESALLENGAAVGAESYASGGQVAWAIDSVGPPPSSATFTVSVPAAGTYTMDIRAASGWSLPDHVLSVNGTVIAPVTYNAIGWNRFLTTSVRIRLNAGQNTIRFAKNAPAGSNTAELDFIEIR